MLSRLAPIALVLAACVLLLVLARDPRGPIPVAGPNSTTRMDPPPPRDFKDVILRSGGCVMLPGSADHDSMPDDPQFLALHAEEVRKLELLERSRKAGRK